MIGEMRIMDAQAGDLKVNWDSENEDEVRAARDQFNAFLKKGYVAYNAKKGGEKGSKMEEFDPEAQLMILSPAPKKGCIANIYCGFNP